MWSNGFLNIKLPEQGNYSETYLYSEKSGIELFHWQFIGFRAIVHVFIWFVNDIVCIPGKNKSSIRNMELLILILSLITWFFYSILTLDFVSYFYYFYSHHKSYANSWQYIAHLWEIVNVERGKWTFFLERWLSRNPLKVLYMLYNQTRAIPDKWATIKWWKMINEISCIYPFFSKVQNLYIVSLCKCISYEIHLSENDHKK